MGAKRRRARPGVRVLDALASERLARLLLDDVDDDLSELDALAYYDPDQVEDCSHAHDQNPD